LERRWPLSLVSRCTSRTEMVVIFGEKVEKGKWRGKVRKDREGFF
jgi:hypothetical protein